MSLPKHIQDGLDKAKELQENLAKKKTGEEKPPAPDSPEAQIYKEDSGVVQDVDLDNEEETPASPEEPKEEEKKEVSKEEDFAYWKQKYNTLKGMYDAEVPRYTAQIRELKRDLQDLQSNIESLKQSPVVDQKVGDINPDDFEEYGEDMKKLVQQVSSLMRNVNKLQDENTKLKKEVTSVAKASHDMSYNDFLKQVRQQVPQFNEQDVDPEFLQWIDSRNIDLNKVAKDRNVKKAVEIYSDYAKLSGKYQTDPPKEEEVDRSKSDRVKQQVAPPRSRPAPVEEKGKKQWTRADVDQVYKDIIKGKYTEQEAFKLKQQIFKAQSDGRIG